MPVADVMYALTGTFTPTQSYSFEFRDTRRDRLLNELFLLLPPDSVRTSEAPRSELMSTIGGGYLVDYGNDYKKISVSGQCHFYYSGTLGGIRPPGRQSDRNNFVTGYDEFIKLRFLLSRYRDYTLTERGKLQAPFFFNPELLPVEAFKIEVQKRIGQKQGALADQISMVWHDYDYDDHWYCKVDSLGMERTGKDNGTVLWNLELIGYRPDTSRTLPRETGTITKRRPVLDALNKATIEIAAAHEESAPTELNIQIQNALFQVTKQTTQSNPPITVVLP